MEIANEVAVLSDKDLLSENLHSRLGSRQRTLLMESGVGDGGQVFIPSLFALSGRISQQESWHCLHRGHAICRHRATRDSS